MVERFEAFMNDEDAGAEGVELDDMDFDDDDEDDESASDEEDKDVSFDEQEFAKMMREMMGMPPDDTSTAKELTRKVEELDSDNEEDNEIRLLSEGMERELNESGALNLDPTSRKIAATKSSGKGKEKAKEDSDEESEDDDSGEVDVDYNLAKNMLEAFKGQTGMAGPAGNLMGLMGVRMPRDERDEGGDN